MPSGTSGLQHVESLRHIAAGSTAHGEFHDEYGHGHTQQEKKVDNKEHGTAVFTRDIRETPYVTEADSTSGRKEQEAQSAGKMFALCHDQFS
jgi:hypothetical protein